MKNKHIYNYLIEKIVAIDVDDKLPSENFLVKKFNVSRNSIRDVFLVLETKNITYAKKGVGHFKKSDYNYKSKLTSSSNLFDREIIHKVLDEKSNLFGKRLLKILNVKKNTLLDGNVIEVQEMYLNVEMFNNLDDVDFTKSLEDIIKSYSSTSVIDLRANVKVIPYVSIYPLCTKYNEIMFSVYEYYNEYDELICLNHSYFTLENFNINYQKTL